MTRPLADTTEFDPKILWNDYRPTGLVDLPALARAANVARVIAKLECERPLGNFKALGGMWASLRALARHCGGVSAREIAAKDSKRAPLPSLICASDGNHGLAVAAAAAKAGTGASVYLPDAVGASRLERIAAYGARIVRISGTYDDAVCEAAAAAARGEGILIADTSRELNDPVVEDVMNGYGLMAAEIKEQLQVGAGAFTHLFLQAGVGGLAAAVALGLRDLMKVRGKLMVVEPAAAPCVAAALQAGRPVQIRGDLQTSAEMLSCGLASAPALQILLHNEAQSVVVQEDQLTSAVKMLLTAGGPNSTPSGAAGLAGLLHVAAQPQLRSQFALNSQSIVLLIVTEAAIK